MTTRAVVSVATTARYKRGMARLDAVLGQQKTCAAKL